MAEAQLDDFPSLFSLKGKVALVTGGSRGLGLYAASAILQAGAATVFISSRKADACEAAVKQLNALPNLAPGARVISVPADSSTEAGVQSMLAGVRAHTDHLDILLANAGATWGEAFDTHGDAALAKVLDLNVRGVFNTVRLFAPLLRARATVEDPSRVLMMASVAGLGTGTLGEHASFGYSMSKAAEINLARNLGVELGPRHITVNAIAPGFFPTRMSRGVIGLAGGAEVMDRGNPMRRLGRPEDIAGVVVYLSSRAGAHVNGTVAVVDGGAMWVRGELTLMGRGGPKL